VDAVWWKENSDDRSAALDELCRSESAWGITSKSWAWVRVSIHMIGRINCNLVRQVVSHILCRIDVASVRFGDPPAWIWYDLRGRLKIAPCLGRKSAYRWENTAACNRTGRLSATPAPNRNTSLETLKPLRMKPCHRIEKLKQRNFLHNCWNWNERTHFEHFILL